MGNEPRHTSDMVMDFWSCRVAMRGTGVASAGLRAARRALGTRGAGCVVCETRARRTPAARRTISIRHSQLQIAQALFLDRCTQSPTPAWYMLVATLAIAYTLSQEYGIARAARRDEITDESISLCGCWLDCRPVRIGRGRACRSAARRVTTALFRLDVARWARLTDPRQTSVDPARPFLRHRRRPGPTRAAAGAACPSERRAAHAAARSARRHPRRGAGAPRSP